MHGHASALQTGLTAFHSKMSTSAMGDGATLKQGFALCHKDMTHGLEYYSFDSFGATLSCRQACRVSFAAGQLGWAFATVGTERAQC